MGTGTCGVGERDCNSRRTGTGAGVSDDLVARLRAYTWQHPITKEAADRIDELERVLKPFLRPGGVFHLAEVNEAHAAMNTPEWQALKARKP